MMGFAARNTPHPQPLSPGGRGEYWTLIVERNSWRVPLHVSGEFHYLCLCLLNQIASGQFKLQTAFACADEDVLL